ncbi:MAG TPA: M1 family metallopeptidase [Patescibacteria group bacterium]|nr:M1 family metallopeptidase [Patescibacteria group bacterium]
MLRTLLLYVAIIATNVSAATAATTDVPRGKLPRLVEPVAYAVDLRMDARADRYSGTVAIELEVKEATDHFYFHARGSTLSDVQLIRARMAPIAAKTELVDAAGGTVRVSSAQPISPGRWQLRLNFDAPYDQRLQGAYKVKTGGADYVMTQMEPLGARNAFPSFDEPAFKTPWTFSITAPKGDTAIFNTQETGTETLSDGWVKHVYAQTKPLPTYLIAFAVGPWEVIDFDAIPKTALRERPIPLRGIAAKGQSQRMKYMLGETAKITIALEEYFDYAYPYDKLDLLAAPDFAYGAMENPGLITYRDSLMFADLKSATSQRRGALGTHTHELGHQWFGNVVTMPWWDDIWLNEAFATWIAAKIVHQIYPELEADMDLLGRGLGAMGSDSLATARRIHNPVEDWTEISSTFDGITYQKGGAVLSMMERYLGKDKFRAALRAHMRKFEFGSATSIDLGDSLAAQSDQPNVLRKAFASFTDQPGVPMLDTTLACKDGKATLSVAQSRYAPIGATFATDTQWRVPMCVRVGRGGESAVECHLLDDATASVALAGDTCPDYVHPNADGAGYYRFRLDDAAQKSLNAAFAKLNAFEQRVLADSLGAAFSSGETSVAQYLDAAPGFAVAQQGDVITAPLGNLEWIKERVATPAQRERIDTMLRDIWGAKLKELGIDHRDGDSEATKSLRVDLIGVLSDHGRPQWLIDDLAARGRKIIGLGGAGKLDADAVHRDLLGVSLRTVAHIEGKAAFDLIEQHLATNEDSVIRGALMGALAATTDAALLDRVLKLGIGPTVKSGELTRLYFGASDQPANHPAIWAFVQQNYDALLNKAPSVWQGKIAFFGSAALCTNAGADELQAFFAERVKDLEGGPRALAQGVEGVKLCAARVAKHQQH